jgi:hypothetical protein
VSSYHGYWEEKELKRNKTYGQRRTKWFSPVKGKVQVKKGQEGPEREQRYSATLSFTLALVRRR